MALNDLMKVDGIIVECLPNNTYKVKCVFDFENKKKEVVLSAYTSGKIQRSKITIINGDTVTLEIPNGIKETCRIISRKRITPMNTHS